MITGFNTDIKHGDRVFHVQTEDRGLGNPVIESLVYVGGEILLSKKSPYEQHVAEGKVDEKTVRQMMDLQHRRIIEAIRRGRFDGARPGEVPPDADESGKFDKVEPAAPLSPAAAAATAALLSGDLARPPAPARPAPPPSAPPPSAPPPSAPPQRTAPAPPRPMTGAGGLSSARSTPPPSPSKAPSGIGVPGERSLDQVIIEYLASEAASEHLEISLVKGGEIASGEPVSLSVRAATSLTEKPVAGAHVTIRVVSTGGAPQVLFRGVTGNDGLVKTTVTVPEVGNANAALIIAATSPLGNNELKQLVKKKAR